MRPLDPVPHRDDVSAHVGQWLGLATASVALSGLFAILIALARVPALGELFPGPEFYRVALTLHVNLSQGVWFLTFAAVQWSLAAGRAPSALDRSLFAAAALGALGIAISVAVGTPTPIMSNYLPVLDSPLFLGALTLFSLALCAKAATVLLPLPRLRFATLDEVRRFGLWSAAAGLLCCALLALRAHLATVGELSGDAYFELLFWAAGHCWQFVLVSLLMVCWLDLAAARCTLLSPRLAGATMVAAALPIVLAFAAGMLLDPLSSAYQQSFTSLMQWTSWAAPLLLAGAILRQRGQRLAQPGFMLSLVLFGFGLLIGALIDGQTTLVTAHYHGTIGAVTLAFMAYSFQLLPRIGAEPVSRRLGTVQLAFYGYGILLMMLGLAGAGLMGAPRKTPGELGLAWSVETVSRFMLGIGGLLATIGILMFATLLARRLWPSALLRTMQDDPAH